MFVEKFSVYDGNPFLSCVLPVLMCNKLDKRLDFARWQFGEYNNLSGKSRISKTYIYSVRQL